MKVRELINMLERFDDDMEVRIGMQQKYGNDFAMNIDWEIETYNINAFYGNDYEAVVITEGEQCGSVDYNGEW